MRLSLAKAVVPVGWPPLEETLQKVVAKKIQIFACGAMEAHRRLMTAVNGISDYRLGHLGIS